MDQGTAGRIHFSLATDPSALNVIYIGGDVTVTVNTTSAAGNTDFTGRLFRVDTNMNFVATMTGNPLTDPARGEQITGQGARLPGALGGMTHAFGLPGAGNVTDGTYRYVVTYVDQAGVQSNPSPELVMVVAGSGGGTTVTLSNIPAGPAGTVARLIHRTEASAFQDS